MKKIESILYVEDEQVTMDLFADFLYQYTDKVYVACNGEEGLKIYKKVAPKLVISDIQMPVMNGIEMIKEIKKINPNQYVCIVTAFNEAHYLMEAIELNINTYLQKPIDLDVIDEKLTFLVNQINLKKELELKNELLQNQAKLAAMGELMSNIAHHWRQPLTIISTNVASVYLKTEFESIKKSDIEDLNNTVNANIEYLSGTIDQFTNYFKDMKSKETFQLQKRITSVVDLVKHLFLQSNIQFDMYLEDESIELNLYVYELEQVLINCLNNSYDVLTKNNITDPWIKVSLKKNNEMVQIIIEDNGGGIEEEVMNRIFEPYFTTKHKSKNVGLSLHLSHKIITELFHGKLYVNNTQNGAEFIIELPLSK